MPEEKITIHSLNQRKSGPDKICAITAYDCTFARLADKAGVDIILVGDSLANTIMGLESTVPVTLEQMIHHATAVCRGCSRALVVADMPFGSVQEGPIPAVSQAVRVFKETGVDAVKIEGGRNMSPVIRAVVEAGIPVMGHVGLMPQYRSMLGGLKVQGKEKEAAHLIIEDAQAMTDAGCFALVLEAVPRELAALITGRIRIPTIGIGAGPDCDGQILVLHDVLGLSEHTPRFVKTWTDLSGQVIETLEAYRREVSSGSFPDDSHSFHMDKSILENL